MEYTKDIVLEIGNKGQVGKGKMREEISNIKKGIINNKIIIITLTILSALMLIDIALVNSFLQVFSKVY